MMIKCTTEISFHNHMIGADGKQKFIEGGREGDGIADSKNLLMMMQVIQGWKYNGLVILLKEK